MAGQQTTIFGLDEPEQEDDYLHEGLPQGSKRYFDATDLPDAPRRQDNADGAQTYILYVVFPTRDDLLRGIEALTLGQRKSLAASAKVGTVNGIGIDKKFKKPFIDLWEEKLLGINRNEPAEDDLADDEAQQPLI